MRLAKLAGVGAVALGAGLLSGCEVREEFAATCTTLAATPPATPQQGPGVVEVDVELPPNVEAGAVFTVRVDHMVGYAGPPGSPTGSGHFGTISVTGPVTPSGDFLVGRSILAHGIPFPNTLQFTATGHPGEQIRLGAVSSSSFHGTFPSGFGTRCNTSADGGAEITSIPIVAPEP